MTFDAWIDTATVEGVVTVFQPAGLREIRPPDGPERQCLIDDVAAFANIFSDAMDGRWRRLRLDVVAGNACRRLHIDRATERPGCTCRGTGTHYDTGREGGRMQSTRSQPGGPSSCAARFGPHGPARASYIAPP